MEGFVSLFLFIVFPLIGIGLIASSLSKKYSSRKRRCFCGVLSLCIPVFYLLGSFNQHDKTNNSIYGEYHLEGEARTKLVLKTDSTFHMDYIPALSNYNKGKWEAIDWDYHELKLESNEVGNQQISFRINIEADKVVLRYYPWKKEDPKLEQELVFMKDKK